MIEIRIRPENAGGRIDKFVLKYLDKAPKNFVYKMLRKKNIVLNDKKTTGSELLKAGDSVKLFLADETIRTFRTEEPAGKSVLQKEIARIKPLILFEDENLLALNKPAGMLSQKSVRTDESLNDLLLAYLQGQASSDAVFTAGISNRLDRNTSGLVLAGKNPAAVRQLNEAIRDKRVGKYYLALVKGSLEKEQEMEAWLVKDREKNRVKVLFQKPEGEASYIKTGCRLLAGTEKVGLLKVNLYTGRSHQIRAHLAALGHPVVGDGKYGNAALNAAFMKKYGLRSQFLHAAEMEFQDMRGILAYLNGQSVSAPLPELFRKILEGEKLWLPGAAEDCGESSLKRS